jgi:alpha-tubulin suppressor-like RCC1 family protein
MKRFAVFLTVAMMGLAWLLTSVVFPAPQVSAVSSSAPKGAVVTVTTPGGLKSLASSRLLDTNIGVGAAAVPVAAFGTVHVQVSGRGGVPASKVSAVVLTVTVTRPAKRGFVSVYADGAARSSASNVNFVPGQSVPNLVVAPVGTNGKVALFNGSDGSLDLLADVAGYYLSGAPKVAGAFGSLAPARLLDSRIGMGTGAGPIAAGGTVDLQVAGRGGVPASGVSVVVLNVTVTAPTGSGSVSVSGGPARSPEVSNVSFGRGQTVPNLVFAAVGPGGKVSLHNSSTGTVHLIADVSGYYLSGPPTAAGAFGPLAPSRLLDTDAGVGAPRAAVAAGDTVHLKVTGSGGVPSSGVSAVALNVTVAGPAKAGSVSVMEDGSPLPRTSNLTFEPGGTVTNLVVSPVAANGKVALHNASGGQIRLTADVAGFFSSKDAVTSVSTGTSHSCEVTKAGGVRCWGLNTHGELGDGTTKSSSVPVDVVGLGSGIKSVSAGLGYTCTVTSAGRVRCWGSNGHGELGDGTTRSSAVPVDVVGLRSGALAVSAGWSHTCAVTSTGAAKCWGHNAFGELGNGTTADSAVPVGVVGLSSGAVAVEVGEFHSCAVTSSGATQCWGYNADGELGNGTTSGSTVPVAVIGLGAKTTRAVSAGRYHSCVVTTAGAVRCWGRGPEGQLGRGTTGDSAVPVGVVGLGSGVVAVSAGRSHTCAVTSAGGVRCWGGRGGELGTGSTTASAVPVGVVGLGSGAAGVSAGGHHTCARSTAGSVTCWGFNGDGGLGNGTVNSSAVPVEVAGTG